MKLGQEILRCQPFAYIVNQRLHKTVCDFCLKRAKIETFQRCSGCKYVYYCKPACQKSSWPQHRDECKYLKAVAPKVPTDTVRLMARIILKLQAGGLREVATLPDGSKRCFEDLLSHQREIVRDSGRLEAFGSFFAVLQDCLSESLPPKPEVLDIYGRILINSFNIMDEEYQPLGVGLYLAASVLDHSCQPTANVVFLGKDLIVRSIQDNGNDDFSAVRISYTNLLNTNQGRRKDLMEQYYFECSCPACENDSSEENLLKIGSVLCQNCSNSISTLSKPDSCPSCNAHVPEAVYEAHCRLSLELKDFTFGQTNQTESDNRCAELYPEMSKVFSPCDRKFIDVLEYLYEDSISGERWSMAHELGLKLLGAYQRLYPAHDVNVALLLMKLGKLTCYLDRFLEAEKHLESAEKIIAVAHGKKHPLYSETLEPLIKEINFQIKAPIENGIMMDPALLEMSKSG